jgi:hypothetical protein
MCNARSGLNGHSVTVNQCCFCDAAVDPFLSDSLTLVLAGASRVADADAPTQQLWCHAECLSDRLSAAVPFESTAFDD